MMLGLLVETSPRVRGWDLVVAQSAAEDTSPFVADVARTVTQLGAGKVYMLFAAVALVILLARRHLRLAGFLATVIVGRWLLGNLLKGAMERERPDLHQLVSASGYSFPSGHASAAAATYLALALVLAVLRPRWNLPRARCGSHRDCRGRGHHSSAARRSLDHRRTSWTCLRLGVVPDLRMGVQSLDNQLCCRVSEPPSPVTLTVTVSPSCTSPPMINRASASPISVWISRRRGRAPYAGS